MHRRFWDRSEVCQICNESKGGFPSTPKRILEKPTAMLPGLLPEQGQWRTATTISPNAVNDVATGHVADAVPKAPVEHFFPVWLSH